ncbi:MAG: hypothetical protein ACKVQK_28480 [Burkholderiales bacterium]
MNYDKLKKNQGQRVRIRPALQHWSDDARLAATLDDTWLIDQVTNNGLTIVNDPTQQHWTLPLDHIYNYLSEPATTPGGPTGMLQLSVQLLFYKSRMQFEPIAPPGKALEKFTPTQTRESLYRRVDEAQKVAELTAKREQYSYSPEGFEAAIVAFKAIGESFVAINADLASRGTPMVMQMLQHGFEMAVFAHGWWITLQWRRAGVLANSELQYRIWDDLPPWRGLVSYGIERMVHEETFKFGLVTVSEALWHRPGSPDQGWTSDGLATDIISYLLEKPGKSAPITNLPTLGRS